MYIAPYANIFSVMYQDIEYIKYSNTLVFRNGKHSSPIRGADFESKPMKN